MKLLKSLFKTATPTSADIAIQIKKARADYDAANVARANLMAGLSTFTDAEHQKAEAEYEVQRRAADRAAARIADLELAHIEAVAAEAAADRLAKDEALRSRAEASRQENMIEAAALLREYDAHAAKISDIVARLDDIDTAREAVNDDLRKNPVTDSVPSFEACHRKHPDREAGVQHAKVLCWVFRYPGSPPDTEDTRYLQLPPREDVRRADIGSDGKVRPAMPEVYNHFGRNVTITPRLEEREIEVSQIRYRPGRSETRLSTLHLPPGFAGGAQHWPR
ncbi:hypothetical protein [Tardiphaga robiniae]|uniref:Uncharacterized protein n=1 Tax=Tardiphaga robiniae TaxID=943830 RepID=A0A7G6U2B6_9BRAD|nr:hypothetical protein [Tardiphaga robiniae]QND73148.1 hypothetical protein HB776_19500 [Tardiphaga robiniae]